MARPVDPKLVELAHRMQLERPQILPRQSVLEAAVVPLAEFRYLGHSLRFMHEFATRAGIRISYNGLVAWAKRRLGTESGPDSLAARIVQQAVDAGDYESPHFKRAGDTKAGPPQRPAPQAAPAAQAPNPSTPPRERPAAPPKPPVPSAAPDSGAQKAARLAVLDQGMQKFQSPFKHIREHKEGRSSE